jgi:SulP family sulfate permease
MLATVVVTVWTHDLARGVLTGVLLSAVFFATKVGRLLDVDSSLSGQGERTYSVKGQIFFASSEAFVEAFDGHEDGLSGVVIDVEEAHFWDVTAVGALDKVVLKFRDRAIPVEVRGLNRASATLVARLGTHDKEDARSAPGH